MSLLDLFRQIKVFVFDVDGVLTDGSLLVFDTGEQVRKMSIKDGFALQLAIKKGYRVVVISGSYSSAVRQRLEKLGVQDVYMRIEDKKLKLEEYLSEHQLSSSEVLFMGDDIPDYAVMKEVGLPCAPSDSAPEIRKISKYVSEAKGGMGCVRDVIEKVLKLNDQWELYTNIPSK
jgi:3-deoxy-D-manno-octulosonate 8-phosphate phosphatase (KDO 8-P phosphatase)